MEAKKDSESKKTESVLHDRETAQSFYILCYFYLSTLCVNKPFSQNCKYFVKSSYDGTWLHKATNHNMAHYSDILYT